MDQLQNIAIKEDIRINKYMPVALLYFFFNSFLLPLGLLYTAILSPLLLLWLYRYQVFNKLWLFFAFLLPFAIIHFIGGVDAYYYFLSSVLLLTVYIFGMAFFQFLRVCHSLRTIFRKILLINFGLVIIACAALFIPPFRNFFWHVSSVSTGLEKLPRLKLFTYEPSFYSLLMVPLALYYYLKIIFLRLPNAGLVLLMVTLPLLLSFSFGTLLGIPLALIILLLLNLKVLFVKQKVLQYIFLIVFFVGIASFLLLLLYPENPLFIRILNLFEGRDSSFKGRGFESYQLAWTVLNERNILFGVGLGQVKVLGLDLWRTFYSYNFSINEVTIPCAMAETLAIFGLVGVAVRIGIQAFFFFRTKVYNNYYRLALFIFIFIYQFTGSFIMNIAEYAIWIMAFYPGLFEEFDRKNIFQKKNNI